MILGLVLLAIGGLLVYSGVTGDNAVNEIGKLLRGEPAFDFEPSPIGVGTTGSGAPLFGEGGRIIDTADEPQPIDPGGKSDDPGGRSDRGDPPKAGVKPTGPKVQSVTGRRIV